MKTRSALLLATASLLLGLVGCLAEDGDGSPAPQAQTYGDEDAQVTVPAGALAQPVELSVTPVASAEEPAFAGEAGLVPGTLHRFGPEGTVFVTPVTITLHYDPALLGDVLPENLRLVWLDEDAQRLVTMGDAVDLAAQTVSGTTTHFSFYGAAPHCAADAHCGAGRRCHRGGCRAGDEPEPEVCGDRLDNDGDGAIDEDCPDPGVPCVQDADCAAGESCVAGLCEPADPRPVCNDDSECALGQVCVDGVCWAEDPNGEICGDGLDNDGDGQVDEGCECSPLAEICDGLDNDCDGEVDEGCGDPGMPCAQDAECPAGLVCVDGVCVGLEPEREVCGDGLDNDGDGLVDEGCGDCVDEDGDGFCADVDCDDANPSVSPATPELVGDGLDNDCDGLVDEDPGDPGMPCAHDAECPAGLICSDGVCVGLEPEREICGDGLDNDGDGLVDEGCGDCVDEDGDGFCTDVDCDDANPSVSPVTPELDGDGIDNDCDGLVDEDHVCGCVQDADCPAQARCDVATCQCVGDLPGDQDADGVPDEADNCPAAANPGQADLDGDGVGDDCDADRDGDGVPNGEDNCVMAPNPDQFDEDGDGQGDACEFDPVCVDEDGDGVCAEADCDDANPTVSPALPEVAGDGLDNDCDGEVDE